MSQDQINQQIRLATLEDAALITLLARLTFKDTFSYAFSDPQDLEDYLDRTFNVPKIRQSLSKASHRYFIALHEEIPVGYAKLKLKSSNDQIKLKELCQLQKIYVLKDFLGSKIGHILQEVVFESALKAGEKHIWLSVYDDNERAIKFYLRNGFTEVGEHPFQIGKDEFRFLILCRAL